MKSRQEFGAEADWKSYLRFYYAGIAMQGMLSNYAYKEMENSKKCATWAVNYADSLLAELTKPRTDSEGKP
jgi:hypothetical protein